MCLRPGNHIDRLALGGWVDVLSAVLRELRLSSAGYRWLELGVPFRVHFDQPGLRGVHHVARGECELVHDDGTVDHLTTAEAFDGGPGSDLVMARLSDALLIRALRHHSRTVDHPGWLTGLRDPCIAAALAAVHTNPAGPWTVAGLAHTAGLSRAAFAARFTRHVGEPVMRYVSAVRMQRAKTLLRDERATVAAVAARLGYQSDVAFAAAFKREVGTSPGAYRRTGDPR